MDSLGWSWHQICAGLAEDKARKSRGPEITRLKAGVAHGLGCEFGPQLLRAWLVWAGITRAGIEPQQWLYLRKKGKKKKRKEKEEEERKTK
ncbi:hypothetical protein TIFTF001_041123 [Ficus carica]|uniref:Uncharacterized protein n=1 Tax=Ficus carica TaxID=3494 RepID=A0AA87Z276_FICCA|nr:hypothetical protein TIFTF001_041113 [Ficus carica]GMN28066.1 hypothetical protein TIFTF001_041117 [Ficus carica]GMN28083.1 hypothetical protein TIFTF001_041119 [Ficus carica]GMN28098.1 hypothetical protein TIFTF001_041123 [Ficus carica]